MASTASSLTSSSTHPLVVEARAPLQSPVAPSQCVSLPTLPTLPQARSSSTWKSAAYCRKIARNVVAMATGEPPADLAVSELPDILKTIQATWDKVEDKYAVSSLGVAVAVGLWGSTGMISAIDRLPLVPGVLELVGIGYTGWFAYKNLIFKPDREALLRKIKDTYADIIGSS